MELYSVSEQEAVRSLRTDPQNGLSREEAGKRLAQFGRNEIITEKKQSMIVRFFSQFKDFMIIILLAAAAVSFGVSWMNGDSEYIDSIIILVIVICNAVISTVQEVKADKAIDALKKLSSPYATVIRSGKKQVTPSGDLVPGDIVILKTGDLVPADIRLLKSVDLKAEESSLTGESVPVEKMSGAVCPKNAGISEQRNMVFASCGIAAGRAVGVVQSTGMRTAMGNIAKMLQHEQAPATPLQNKLKQTGKFLGLGVIGICVIIFVLGLLQKTEPFEMFMIAISLAVAAIPEGMPAVVTIVLSIGIKRMAVKRAIVRHMPAVETLGCTQVICSDKTGTLTQNKMTVVTYVEADGERNLESDNAQFAMGLCTLCNNSEVIGEKISGDPTEMAFLHAYGHSKAEIERSYPRVGEIPFTSERKMMSTAHKMKNGFRIISKGAPDVLLKKCSHYVKNGSVQPLDSGTRARILYENGRLASAALRVLSVAYRDVDRIPQDDRQTESELVFCGLAAMEDPPRKGVKTAVHTCKKAGIIPVMITGDHAITAHAIGKRLDIADDGSGSITGPELDKMGDSELTRRIFEFRIFARVSPEHKVRIVKAFQRRGMVVAMTGDGVNDAPALKAADIGCAMGKNGTEVAKSAADMVLTDDDFSTIVSAVREGRGIYKNIRKTIHFLISCNIGEILLIFTSFLLRVPTPLIAIQLLWVNLVTDSLPALALGADPIEKDIMQEKPHKKSESIFSGGMGFSIIVEGCLIGALALLSYTVGRMFFDLDPADPVVGRTMAFAVLSLSQLFHSFNMRSEHSVFTVGFFSNKKLVYACIVCAVLMVCVVAFPPLTVIFKTTTLNLTQWLMVIALSMFPLLAVELEKSFFQPKEKKEKVKKRDKAGKPGSWKALSR